MILVLACVLLLASQLPGVGVCRVHYKTVVRNVAALGCPVLLLLEGDINLPQAGGNLPFDLQWSAASLRSVVFTLGAPSGLWSEPRWSQLSVGLQGRGWGGGF